MFAQITFVPTNYFAVGTPRVGGVPTCTLIAICTLCAASAMDALVRGGCPCAHALLCYSTQVHYCRYTVCAHRKQTGISLSTPSSPFELAELPFPSFWGWEAERDSALQFSEMYR
jgi:hypothetical protein